MTKEQKEEKDLLIGYFLLPMQMTFTKDILSHDKKLALNPFRAGQTPCWHREGTIILMPINCSRELLLMDFCLILSLLQSPQDLLLLPLTNINSFQTTYKYKEICFLRGGRHVCHFFLTLLLVRYIVIICPRI